MFRISLGRVYWLIGVGFFIGISVYRTPDARAQDANTASVAELQQRVQDLEAVVRQLQENRDPDPAPTPPVALPSGDPAAPAAPSAAPLRTRAIDPAAPNPPAGSAATPSTVEFRRLEQRLLPAVSRSDRASCGSRAKSRRIFADSSIASTRPRPPMRPWRAARPRAVRIRSSSAAHASVSRPRW